ncbi:putative long-chain-alcohol O-fatty-acyltransferase 4 [Hordeum vulgare]|nr:putative long-chain-alcohol O-fatty-acyltransferase 4 [Hordeum vulgare]
MADSASGARLLAGRAPRFFLILNRGQGSWGRSGEQRGLQEGWWEVGGEAASRRVQRALLVLGMGLESQFDRPYLSASLWDFWGRRWNLSVPVVLRSGVYRPVRARLGPAAGVLAAFVVSGLVHELMFYPPGRTWCGRPSGRRRPSSRCTAHALWRRRDCCTRLDWIAVACKLQVKTLGKFFAMSFSWGFFQWFYTGGKDCGFSSFPTLGLEARKQKFFFDFFPGVGHAENDYLLLGRFAMNQSRFFFDFFPAASTASSATGCYLFWTIELDLLDLEPVQILPQSSTSCY